MRLYCVRHGQPEEATAELSDPGLSKEGKQDIQSMAEYLCDRIPPINYLYTSPKQRTKETAAIFHDGLGVSEPLQEQSYLRPGQSVEALSELVWTWQDDTMLVSHNPLVGELVSQLVLDSPVREVVRFTPGTIVCLERQQSGHWVVNWVLRPTLLKHVK